MTRAYDIVIFGASGFTGEYVIENLVKYLAKSRSNLKWAAAGRSESKIQATLSSVGVRIGHDLSRTAIIIASVGDDNSLDSMAKQTTLLINCTGPFRFFGEPVVASCVRSATHYIDITGEPQFMENMQLKYDAAAREKGIYIIPSCGFDSIPCDIGVNFIKDSFKPGRLSSVETFLSTFGAMTGNHTTWDSAVEGLADTETLIKVRKQLYAEQYPEVSKMKSKFPLKQRGIGHFSDDSTGLSGWIMPFIGADRSVVRRSQMSNYMYHNKEYIVQMEAYVMYSLWMLIRWAFAGLWLKMFNRWAWGRSLLKRFPAFFTNGMFTETGPSREETDTSTFQIVFLAKGWKDGQDQEKEPTSSIAAKVSGPHLGYPTCAICVVQSAVTLLEETSSLPSTGGSFPPGAAFRNTTLIDRLNANGLKFELLSKL